MQTPTEALEAPDSPDRGRPGADAPDPSLFSTLLLSYHEGLDSPVLPRPKIEPIEEMCWNARYRLVRLLGSGAQGVVYLAHRDGADGYGTRVAVKLYFRHEQQSLGAYRGEMRRIAEQAQWVSQIQHDNLVGIRDFVSLDETRVMVMEWVDGLDLRQLLDPERLVALRQKLTRAEWDRLNDVVVTYGEDHCRLKPGVAVDILRGCLAGLSALHHHGIVHSDLKPANIMIKRTGTKKLIDLDSSCRIVSEAAPAVRGTPYYMAPEQLSEHKVRFRSDIASLGYILLEMLTGRLLFKNCRSVEDLLQAKVRLPERVPDLLPGPIRGNPNLVGLCRKMVAVDPHERFPDADAADLSMLGAASFHRQLVKSDLSAEYDRELAWWLEVAEPPRRED